MARGALVRDGVLGPYSHVICPQTVDKRRRFVHLGDETDPGLPTVVVPRLPRHVITMFPFSAAQKRIYPWHIPR